MKFLLYTLLSFAGFLSIGLGFVFLSSRLSESNLGGTVIAVFQGGTGTTTAPASQVLYGGNSGVYQSVATGTVSAGAGISVTGSRYVLGGGLTIASTVAFPFTQDSNFSQNTISTSTAALWLKTSPYSLMASTTALFSAIGVGTTSPYYPMFIASSSISSNTNHPFGQLALSDIRGGSGLKHWLVSSMGGELIFSTTTDAFATSSTNAIKVDINGKVTFGTTQQTCIALTGSSALCDADDATGAGGAGNPTKWATSTADALAIYTNSGYKIGIGSSTPWAGISFASTTMSYQYPAMAISTSTDSAGNLFSIFSTTTVQKSVSAALSLLRDVGVRIGIGSFSQYGFDGLLDHLYVQGRINTGDWLEYHCLGMGPTVASVTADTGNMPCPYWSFEIDTAGSITTVSRAVAGENYGGAINSNAAANAANNGAGIFFAPVAASNNLKFSTSTPVMEGTVSISPYSASSTSFYFGFSNLNSASNAFETFPTAGCFFNASSTAQTGNWYAVSNVVAGAGSATFVNTGIASSSLINGAFGASGNYYRMRIEADRDACRFYLQPPDSATTTMVANVTTTIASTTAMTPGIWLGYATAGRVKTIESSYIKLWVRDTLFR